MKNIQDTKKEKTKRKAWKTILVIIGCLVFVVAYCMACYKGYKGTEHTNGDFVYIKEDPFRAEVRITNLSEQGLQKEILIVPSHIKGKRVVSLGSRYRLTYKQNEGGWASEKLKKVIIETDKLTIYTEKVFEQCKQLEKIVLVRVEKLSHYVVTEANIFLSSDYHEHSGGFRRAQIANLSFRYNYEDAENYGVYWLDDIDYGSKITLLPAIPVRVGYVFDGWHKEPECIHKWDFETDTLPTEQVDENGKTILQETKLFAKWDKQ